MKFEPRIGSIFPFLSVLLLLASQLRAENRHEIAFSGGAGSVLTKTDGGFSPIFSFSYRFHFTRRFSAEGALTSFWYRFRTGLPGETYEYEYNDDYSGAEASVVYDFADNRTTKRPIPFVAAGVGKTTTDFTEIPASIYYRAGAGVSYFVTTKVGLRVEGREEMISKLWSNGSPRANMPSLRIGIVYRF